VENLRNQDFLDTTVPWKTVRDAIQDLPDPRETNPVPNHRFQPGARSYPGHTGSPLDEPSKALKAGDHGVPGGENMLRHPNGRVRYFSIRESARIQTFPDEFVFPGSWTESMRQLGNAVPVELARVVAGSIAGKIRKPVLEKA
jgi:DNA (cytosine-5)-methyltransferase 1